jgi:hypothetical protein
LPYLVPAGIVTTLGSEAAAGAGFGVAAAAVEAGELAAALSGFCVSAACPNAIPEISNKIHSTRIATSRRPIVARTRSGREYRN